MPQYTTRAGGPGGNHDPRPGGKFDENAPQIVENVSSDDYLNPPRHSYFARIKEKKSRLEGLYLQFEGRHAVLTDRQAFNDLMREV